MIEIQPFDYQDFDNRIDDLKSYCKIIGKQKTQEQIATDLLIKTGRSVAEIAFKCGFNNIANFNRVFKKNKNCTPSQYREEFRGIKRVL